MSWLVLSVLVTVQHELSYPTTSLFSLGFDPMWNLEAEAILCLLSFEEIVSCGNFFVNLLACGKAGFLVSWAQIAGARIQMINLGSSCV